MSVRLHMEPQTARVHEHSVEVANDIRIAAPGRPWDGGQTHDCPYCAPSPVTQVEIPTQVVHGS